MGEDALERLRGVVRDCASKHLYSSAIFFADKVAAITSDPADIYMQAQALFLARHYRRALHVLNSSQTVLRDPRFRYLAAKCLEELKEWHQCLAMLGDEKSDGHGNGNNMKDCNAMYLDKDGGDYEINITSAICFLRGKAYEALENRDVARQWYEAAFKEDPLCYEALERLINNYMLTSEEEATLLSSITFSPKDGWLSKFYSCLLKKYEKETAIEAKYEELEKETCDIGSANLSFNQTLNNNTDLLACKAEYYNQCGEYEKCFALTSAMLEKDPFHSKCTLIHLIASVELGRANDLYSMAHDLVKDNPQKALSWFAVGCYYFCIKKFDQARRYFGKATSLDGSFAPAWLGSGNAFAALEDSDQTMASLRTSARLFPGCHLPTLYIGMEYMRTHNYKLAEQFFMQARNVCPFDPLVYNELGVVAYHTKQYHDAVERFEKALDHMPYPRCEITEIWEPTLVNLAHALRKCRRFSEAESCYATALSLSTGNLSAYAGLAYCYHMQDKLDLAITNYHKALWLKADDQFCTEMLTLALQEASSKHMPMLDAQ